MKKIISTIGLIGLIVLMTGLLTAAAPLPVTTFELVNGLTPPTFTMNVGETVTVVVQVKSNVPFLFAQALPTAQFPGRGVVGAVGDHVGAGTTATLEVTFTAKNPTDLYANTPGFSPVSVIVGVRYKGGYVATQRYDFIVKVP